MEKRDKKFFVAGLIMMAFSSIISVYAASYLFESEQVSYDNTSSGLTSTNVQDSLDELYNHATDYTEIKSYFQNSPTSYFDGQWIRTKVNNGDGGFQIKDSNNQSRSNFYYAESGDVTYITANDSSGTWGYGKLYLFSNTIDIGNPTNNATVRINGSEVAKKPVAIGPTTTHFTSSTSLEYTGVSVQVPANSCYSLSFLAVYEYSRPTQILISTSSTTTVATTVAEGTATTNASTSYSGCTGSSAVTFYVWAKYSGATNNQIKISGFYIPG